MRGVATVPRLVQTMVMEWSPESDEPWPSNRPIAESEAESASESETTIEELAVAVGRARDARTPKIEIPDELIFEPSF